MSQFVLDISGMHDHSHGDEHNHNHAVAMGLGAVEELGQDGEETRGALENLKPALDNERGQKEEEEKEEEEKEEEEKVKGVKEKVEENKVIRTRRHSPRVTLTLQVKEERETSPEDSRKATRKVNPKFFGGAGGNWKGN